MTRSHAAHAPPERPPPGSDLDRRAPPASRAPPQRVPPSRDRLPSCVRTARNARRDVNLVPETNLRSVSQSSTWLAGTTSPSLEHPEPTSSRSALELASSNSDGLKTVCDQASQSSGILECSYARYGPNGRAKSSSTLTDLPARKTEVEGAASRTFAREWKPACDSSSLLE